MCDVELNLVGAVEPVSGGGSGGGELACLHFGGMWLRVLTCAVPAHGEWRARCQVRSVALPGRAERRETSRSAARGGLVATPAQLGISAPWSGRAPRDSPDRCRDKLLPEGSMCIVQNTSLKRSQGGQGT
nr:gamma-glutamylaminecyclotransferase isoform X2 [Mus musculus]|eukprot:XP_017171479.1 PREDICTED: gamma-glutamylaminecyclotransferase isoform X2 [Mus musculus]